MTLADIQKASLLIKPHINRTTLEYSANCSKLSGFDVFLKYENFQLTGSFKIRGAANKLIQLTDAEKKAGVIAASAGNHAQGVACIAQKLGIKATIVMPEQSPLIKVVSTKRFGAEVILKGVAYDEAYQHALTLQKISGAIFIHPFEDEKIIAGQGTIGLEIFEDIPDAEVVFIPIGGGGLLSGIAIALKSLNPKIKIIGVQAVGADSMAQSFRDKKLVMELKPVSTIADGIAVKRPSQVMYDSFISKLCDDVVTVSDDEIAKIIVFLMERAKTVVEGAGASSLAALVAHKDKFKCKKAVALLSGGNIDLNMLERIIDRGFQVSGRLAKITVAAPDVPGTLNKLTTLIAEKRANVLQINHNRMSDRIHLRETIIEFTLETTGQDQIDEIKKGFVALGSKVIE
ncbi:MAG: threonine ammonia-lyase [Oligoflexia bacterium]|nr:threonine ammonia-lyase [Oligoflexia bacterium]